MEGELFIKEEVLVTGKQCRITILVEQQELEFSV